MTNKFPAALGNRAPLQTRTRVAIVRLACLALAGAAAWPLLDISLPRKSADMMAPAAPVQRVRLHAPAPKVAPAQRAQVIIRSERPAIKPIVAKEIKAVDLPNTVLQELPEMAVTPPAAVPPPGVPQLFLGQPELPKALPPIPPDDLPPVTTYTDKPGGDVVILAVKLNSDNIVVLTDILVASKTPFSDLAFAMATTGTQWKKVDPPIPPGEHRWLEVRINYATSADDNSSVLP